MFMFMFVPTGTATRTGAVTGRGTEPKEVRGETPGGEVPAMAGPTCPTILPSAGMPLPGVRWPRKCCCGAPASVDNEAVHMPLSPMEVETAATTTLLPDAEGVREWVGRRPEKLRNGIVGVCPREWNVPLEASRETDMFSGEAGSCRWTTTASGGLTYGILATLTALIEPAVASRDIDLAGVSMSSPPEYMCDMCPIPLVRPLADMSPETWEVLLW
mmetsp:Transcript_37421/g.82072  ORF Transcript_37421/g.82072 Transcript_37421/m.82072 type:complete len:216 (-) Transcript_37421:1757-2404(-)